MDGNRDEVARSHPSQDAGGRMNLGWSACQDRAFENVCLPVAGMPYRGRPVLAYPIPNGGIPAALLVQAVWNDRVSPVGTGSHTTGLSLQLTESPELADVFIDDIIDSGATKVRWRDKFPNTPFYALADKTNGDPHCWISFPWERMVKEDGPHDNVRRLLQYIGEDVEREGLVRTPDRVVKSYAKLFGGYKEDPAYVMTTFTEGACDEMVVLAAVEFYSTCEHHLLPFFGKAHIAYIPDGKVIGVSKLARLLEIYSRRLQIQERLCKQVTGALMEGLAPKGAACVLQAQHLCMVARGVEKQNSVMTTSSLEGVFRKPEVRAEFYSIIQHR